MQEIGDLETKYLLKIVKCFLEEKDFVVSEEIDEVNLYRLAKKHGLSHFLIDWARKSCKSQEIKNKIEQDYTNQIVKDTNENIEFKKILDAFEKNDIQTLVFKGFLMKAVYPQDYMRQMCDIDLLVAPRDFKRAVKILKELGYQHIYDLEIHENFIKLPFISVELHKNLSYSRENEGKYFNHEVWNFVIPYKSYHNVYQMTLEDSYVFCIAHLIRHVKSPGIKLRDVLDVYLYNEAYKNTLAQARIEQKLTEFGIDKFEQNIREIAYHWFGEKPDYTLGEIEKFILRGPTNTNQVHFEILENGGKSAYIRHFIFPPFRTMKAKYPILKKAPILLPFTWIARFIEDAFSTRASFEDRLNRIKMIQEANFEDVKSMQEIYENLGIVRKED